MQVDNEIAHMGIVDRLLGFCLPSDISGSIIRKDAHNFDLVEILELAATELGELPAEHEMKQLFLFGMRFCRHESILRQNPGRARFGDPSTLREFGFAVAHKPDKRAMTGS